MAGVIHVDWYATVLRKEQFADAVAAVAPLALRYGATAYSVHRSLDDRYKIMQMAWFDSHAGWYSYWEGPEMIEFRRRWMGKYQIPITYSWYEEMVAGALGPEVELEPEATPPPAAVPPAFA
ncbi:MAG TPA: hypothetical protein VMB27_25225 [Solirubrobacteraceae bacterium]|nr:hypothetical protein [Solirubrobacteraceae bacterium]